MNRINKICILLLTLGGLCIGLTSCEDNINGASIVGTWADGDIVLSLGKDGSYRMEDSQGQLRLGSYSYNSSTQLMTVNIKALAGSNTAYKETFIVQTLTSSTLVLLYTDGSVQGYYTRH